MITNTQRKDHLSTRRITQCVLALSIAGTAGVLAQETNAPGLMKPTVVTGSYIPTADTVGPAPVETIAPAQIEKTGTTDLLTALKSISTSFSGGFNVGQTANNGGFGESYVAIRNLPTLVLVDGQRLNITPFSTFFGTYAVDLNTFPLAMIERVEILKDGASPIYGSDAIGGVVNLITKKDFNGVQVDAHVGLGQDSGTYTEARFDAILGYSKNGTKLVAGAQYYYSDPIYTKDRSPGGLSAQELQAMGLNAPTYFSPSYNGRVDSFLLAGSPLAQGAPGYIAGLNAPPNDPYIQAQIAALPVAQRNIPNYNNIVLSDPAWGHPGMSPYIPISSTPNSIALGGSPSILNTTLLNTVTVQQQDRRNVFANASQEIFGKQLEIYGQLLYSETQSRGQLAPAPIPLLSLYNLTIPADNPDNILQIPIGSGATNATPRVRSRLIETGNRIFDSISSSWHFVGGLKGDLDDNKYHYDASAGYSQTTQDQIQNSASSILLNQAMTPFGNAGLSALTDSAGNHLPLYNMYALPGVNSPATINAIKASDGQGGFSDLLTAQGTISGDLFNLPAGKFQMAVGAQYVNESLKTTAGALLASGNLIGLNAIPPFSGGVRDRYAGFIEAKFPIFSPEKNIKGFYDFEIDAAGRYESVQSVSPNSSVHDSLVPKVGFRWQPIDEQWTIRGTYSQGFVVEPLIQLYGPPLQGNPTLVLPADVTDLTPTAAQQTVNELSNPDLAPSKAETITLGTVFTPKFLKGVTLSVDYYHIKETDVPFYPSGSAVGNDLNANGVNSIYYNNPNLHGTPVYTLNGVSYAPTPGDPTTYITANNFDTMNLPLLNGGKVRTDGLDFTLNYHHDTESWGSFNIFVNANLTMSFDVALPGGSYHTYKGQYTDSQVVPAAQGTIPDYNINTGLTWSFKNFDYTILAHYVPSVTDLGDAHPNVGAPSNDFTQSGGAWNVPAYFKIDMQIAYNFKSDTGKKWYDNTRVAVGCNNITDEKAPIIASSSEDNTDKSTYDIIGRFVYFEISKKF
jgi:iron complex outermembrane receptor protein